MSVRDLYPGVSDDFALLENAGGSQLPGSVIEEISRFMREDFVQTGAGYAASERASAIYAEAHVVADELMGARDAGVTALGDSTSTMLARLAWGLRKWVGDGEIVVSVANHEANIGPWLRLQEQGAKIVWWEADPDSGLSDLDRLASSLNQRTRIVALPQSSNLLGDRIDVESVAQVSHEVGAKVVVDGVAHAPHHPVEAASWGVDFYAFSTYKVFGPHLGLLYGSHSAWSDVEGQNHVFNPKTMPTAFELGCLPYELLAGLVKLRDHFATVPFAEMSRLEEPLIHRMVEWLNSRDDLRWFGPKSADRHPTFSFVHDRLPSDRIAAECAKRNIGLRNGHMYAYRLCKAMGVDPDPGVVRLSAVHYNTEAEIERATHVLDAIFDQA